MEHNPEPRRQIYPEPGHCPGGESGAPRNSLAHPCVEGRGESRRQDGAPPQDGWVEIQSTGLRLEQLPSDPGFPTQCCVTWGLSPHLSEPQLPHLWSVGTRGTSLVGSLCRRLSTVPATKKKKKKAPSKLEQHAGRGKGAKPSSISSITYSFNKYPPF